MQIIVLGSAAGGGFPQWNCGCAGCIRARAGDPAARPRTQTQLAASGNGTEWLLLGASPDLRGQILATPALTPRAHRRSPITDVVLLNADIDGIAGLLTLRERAPFRLLAPDFVLAILAANAIFDVLAPDLVPRVAIAPETAIAAAGLTVTLVPFPGKIPLYQESAGAQHPEPGTVYAARLESGGRRALIAPSCAAMTLSVAADIAAADLILFDGTLFTDTEMIAAGLGPKTSRRMGHVPMAGEGGSLPVLATAPGQTAYIHLNNSNPALLDDTAARQTVAAAGVGVAEDGMQFEL